MCFLFGGSTVKDPVILSTIERFPSLWRLTLQESEHFGISSARLFVLHPLLGHCDQDNSQLLTNSPYDVT